MTRIRKTAIGAAVLLAVGFGGLLAARPPRQPANPDFQIGFDEGVHWGIVAAITRTNRQCYYMNEIRPSARDLYNIFAKHGEVTNRYWPEGEK
jgi:hypothetical protein